MAVPGWIVSDRVEMSSSVSSRAEHVVLSSTLVVAFAAVSFLVATGASLAAVVFVSVGAIVIAGHRTALRWEVLFGALIALMFFLPMRRWVIPSGLPFQIEPYRVLIAFIIVGWSASLLVDRRVRVRRTGLEEPLALIVVATVISVFANPALVDTVSAQVAKSLTFFASFVIIFFFIVSVVRTRAMADRLLKFLVVSAKHPSGSSAILRVSRCHLTHSTGLPPNFRSLRRTKPEQS